MCIHGYSPANMAPPEAWAGSDLIVSCRHLHRYKQAHSGLNKLRTAPFFRASMQHGLNVCVLPACFQFMHLICDGFVFLCALQAQLVIQTCSSLRDTLEGLRQIFPASTQQRVWSCCVTGSHYFPLTSFAFIRSENWAKFTVSVS